MKNKYFSVKPIGGVEEIGSNMTLIRTQHEDVIVDCGMLFPFDDSFDINYLIPDFSSLDSSRIKNVVITHAHEDHIGALGHLLEAFPDVTVHASQFALNLIRRKLESFKVRLNFKLYDTTSELDFDSITISAVHVNHSIPETAGLVIRTKDLTWGALYISDFKVDLSSQHEPPIDLDRICALLGPCKHTAFFLDSTNILNHGKTTSEGQLTEGLEALVNSRNQRVYITLFASNVHRVSAIARMGQRAGRKLVLMGRSLRTYLEAAHESGVTDISPEDFAQPDQVKGESGKMLIFLSGCQGDFLSALRRFSFGEDSHFKPTPEDLVIFSSKVIPGNEKKVFRIYNKLTEFGAEIVTASDSMIHASGHPGKEDLKILLGRIQPDFYFPIHGESYFLRKHVQFVEDNFPEVRTTMIRNYTEVHLREGNYALEEHAPLDPLLVHGKNLLIEKTQISQRRKLATLGCVFLTYHQSRGEFSVSTLGLPLLAAELLPKLEDKLHHQLKTNLDGRETGYVKEQLRISTRQFFNHILGYKPVTEVHVI